MNLDRFKTNHDEVQEMSNEEEGVKTLSTKFEIRNKFEIQMTQIQNYETTFWHDGPMFWSFRF